MPIATLKSANIEQAITKTLQQTGLAPNDEFVSLLECHGATLNEAANQLSNLLIGGREQTRLRAIEMVSRAYGVDLSSKPEDKDKGLVVNIQINAENAQINSLFNPERKIS